MAKSGSGDDPASPCHPGTAPSSNGGFPMSWTILFLAGLFEVVWAVGLKYTEGFTRLWPSVGTLAAMALSFYLLAVAMRSLPLGTAYAVWVGIGAIGTAILGIVLFNEPASAGRLVSLGLILAGIIGLKLASGRARLVARRGRRPRPGVEDRT